MSDFYSNDELYHHGVKGMKWGVRKATYLGKADLYRKAATDSNSNSKSKKLNAKADKWQSKAEALDTRKGRNVYRFKKNVARGTVITAGLLAAGFGAKKIRELGVESGKKYYEDYYDLVKGSKKGSLDDMLYKKMNNMTVKNAVRKAFIG